MLPHHELEYFITYIFYSLINYSFSQFIHQFFTSIHLGARFSNSLVTIVIVIA